MTVVTERTAAIEIIGLSFSYHNDDARTAQAPALKNVHLHIDRGTISVVIGPSGCGKTTLLRCLTGVIPSITGGTLSGRVTVGDFDVTAGVKPHDVALTAGLVMQEPDHQIVMTTVEDDLAFGPENRMIPPAEIRARTDACALDVGLSRKLLDAPVTLSGGEKQRLVIGGDLACGPDILLFDEPMGRLDAQGRAMFADLARGLKADGKTLVVVEHDYETLDFADTWILMKDGTIVHASAPKDAPSKLLKEALWL
jgi:energy-coupling factor transporter ATP-binding protein EcfA2